MYIAFRNARQKYSFQHVSANALMNLSVSNSADQGATIVVAIIFEEFYEFLDSIMNNDL
jgi:hypothetical protein